MPRLSGWITAAMLAASLPLVVLATAPALPTPVRLAVVLVFVLFVPGAAVAYALGLDDPLRFTVVAIGVSVALLLLFAQLSVMTIGLSPRLVLAALIMTTVGGIVVRLVARIRRREGRDAV
jgi:hypothetical protein